MKPNVIPLTPQGHFVPQLYHRKAQGMSSLKTSSWYSRGCDANLCISITAKIPV